MLAPVVAVAMVTLTVLSNVLPFGVNVGVAAAAFFVNVAVATALSEFPLLIAIAFTVVVAVSVNGPVYNVEALVGVVPLVV